jgi:hypothetical protein
VTELNAGAVLDRMQQVVGVRTDIALGKHFGFGTSTVSGWRTRNRVPYEECVILAKRNRVSLDWLLLGIGTMDATMPPVGVPDDARLQRLDQFLSHWHATRSEDDQVWLEMQLARAIPEYAEWLAARGK